MKFGLFIFFLFNLHIKVEASNYAFFAGEAENPGMDQFKNGFGMLSLISDSKNWDSAFLTRQTTDQTKAFTKENFERQLKEVKARLSGEEGVKSFVAGDQLMLMIETHGYQKQDNESTHSISTLTEPVKLDGLQELIDLAEKKGVKLAIIDHSCYSGNILNLDYKTSCMLTAASRNNVGFSNHGTDFAFNLQNSIRKEKSKKVSLEDVFLESRLTKRNASQPLISTEAGLKTFEFLESLEVYFKTYDVIPFTFPLMCKEHSITQKNQLDLLKVSLKSQIADEKVYNKIFDKFKRLANVKTDFGNNVDYVAKLRSEMVTVCYYPDTNLSKKAFNCSFPETKLYLKKNEESKDVSTKGTFELEDEDSKNYIERKCVAKYFDDTNSIEKGFISCMSANSDYFDEKNIQKSIDSPYSERDKKHDINCLLALQNLNEEEKEKLRIKKELSKLSNDSAKSWHDTQIQVLGNWETEIYDELYTYFSKKSKTKNSCAEFILN